MVVKSKAFKDMFRVPKKVLKKRLPNKEIVTKIADPPMSKEERQAKREAAHKEATKDHPKIGKKKARRLKKLEHEIKEGKLKKSDKSIDELTNQKKNKLLVHYEVNAKDEAELRNRFVDQGVNSPFFMS